MESGAEIRDAQAVFYRSPHEFSAFTFDQFPQLDERFYDDTAHALEQMGFRLFHDMRDVTVSQATGVAQCGRVMGDSSGVARAVILHLRVAGWKRWVALFRGVPRDIRAVQFLTELEDARFIMTNNAAQAPVGGPFPATWVPERHPRGIGLEELYARHLERVEESLGIPVKIKRPGDAFASYDRQWEQAAAFWSTHVERLAEADVVDV